MIQEYIPGEQEDLATLLLDAEGVLKMVFCPEEDAESTPTASTLRDSS